MKSMSVALSMSALCTIRRGFAYRASPPDCCSAPKAHVGRIEIPLGGASTSHTKHIARTRRGGGDLRSNRRDEAEECERCERSVV